MKLYTLTVNIKVGSRYVCRVIAISGTDCLDTLCDVILDEFGLALEAGYEFCFNGRLNDENNYIFDPEKFVENVSGVELDSLRLRVGKRFLFHYYNKVFVISVSKIEITDEYVEPYLVLKSGTMPHYSWFWYT